MSKNLIAVIVVVLLLGIGGWLFLNSRQSQISTPTTSTDSTQSAQPSVSTESGMVTEAIVTISSTGYSPKDITIKVGETITWVNEDTADHNVNSAPHPEHTTYPRLNLETIRPGEKKSLSFPEAGTFRYHDHLNPTLFGSITVE